MQEFVFMISFKEAIPFFSILSYLFSNFSSSYILHIEIIIRLSADNCYFSRKQKQQLIPPLVFMWGMCHSPLCQFIHNKNLGNKRDCVFL